MRWAGNRVFVIAGIRQANIGGAPGWSWSAAAIRRSASSMGAIRSVAYHLGLWVVVCY
jgi:hypothetical protein